MKSLFRIAPARFSEDLSGEGARLSGGRWSPRGVPVIYAAEAAALAALEVVVHIADAANAPDDLRLIEFALDSAVPLEELSAGDLPEDWRVSPAPLPLQRFGAEWAARASAVGLRVPSVVMPFGHHSNVLINPRFPDFGRLFRILRIDPFEFDSRIPVPR